jgi:hypothetical protein
MRNTFFGSKFDGLAYNLCFKFLELENGHIFLLIHLNIIVFNFTKFEKCSFDHFFVDTRIVEVSHLFTDTLQISQFFNILNQNVTSLLFVEYKENWFYVIFRDSYFIFGIGYDFENSSTKWIIIDFWLLCKVVEYSVYIGTVRLICNQFYLFLHFLHFDWNDKISLFINLLNVLISLTETINFLKSLWLTTFTNIVIIFVV